MILFCRYSWLRNDYPLDMYAAENIRQVGDGTGSFIIEPATNFDEGSYLCKAKSQYGIAVSNTSLLQKAVLLPSTGAPRNFTKTAGQYLHVPVLPLKCFPPASFSWIVAHIIDSDDAPPSHYVETNRRIQISENGKYNTMWSLP